MAKVKQLVDISTGENVYPITSTQVVYDADGNTVEELLAKKQDIEDDDLETDSNTIVGAINELNSREFGNVSSMYFVKNIDDIKLFATIVAQQYGFTADYTDWEEGDVLEIQKSYVYAIDLTQTFEMIFPEIDDTEGTYSILIIDTRNNANGAEILGGTDWEGDFDLYTNTVHIYVLSNGRIYQMGLEDTIPVVESQLQNYNHSPSRYGFESEIFAGFAKTTYLSDGRVVEDVLESLENSSGSGGSVDLSNYYTKTDFPLNHASTATTYGVGTYTNYGHLRLYSTFNSGSSYGTSSGYAATPSAVYSAYRYSYLPSASTSTNTNYPLIFGSYSSTGSSLYCNSGITINPSTNTLTGISKLYTEGGITIDGGNAGVIIQVTGLGRDTDALDLVSIYNNTYIDGKLLVDNIITSYSGFVGDLTGNADTATKATQDASGNVITETYEEKTKKQEISVSTTFTSENDNGIYTLIDSTDDSLNITISSDFIDNKCSCLLFVYNCNAYEWSVSGGDNDLFYAGTWDANYLMSVAIVGNTVKLTPYN